MDVKSEIKPEIKVDAAEGSNLNDIEEYEDDIDLTFPDPNAQAWLVKVPEDLWKAWAEIYKEAPDDSQIEIGKMRIFDQPPGQEDPIKQKLQIRLHPHVPQHENISKKYDLAVTTNGCSNVCVFSEKDLPGHKRQAFGRNRSNFQAGSKPTGIPSRDQRYGRYGKSRSAIPKQTSLAPKIQHEATATPHMDDEYLAKFGRTWAASLAPKSRTTFLSSVDQSLNPNQRANLSAFNTFGLSSKPGKGKKAAAAARNKDKAVRMEKGDLLDALQRCFRRYRYWSMKALRNELRQPEAWIKEVLEDIAVLVRSGDFAMNYTLRPDMVNIIKDEDDVKEETAKIESGTDTGVGSGDEMGDEDEDLEDDFEDVKMEGGV